MKICFYNLAAGHSTGGLQTYCWEAGHALVKRGHDVTIVAGVGEEARYGVVKLVQFPFKERASFPDFGSRFRKLMERLSFARYALPHLLDAGYDAVIINKPFDFPAVWLARKRGMKSLVAFRSGGTDFFLGDRQFIGAVDIWLSASHFNALQIENRYHKSVTVVHNGVDTDKFYPSGRRNTLRQRLGIPSGASLIMSVGRLVGWKGINIIIESIVHLEECHFAIVGDGPEMANLKSLANKHNISNRVHFLGKIEHHLLPELLQEADIFTQPSIGDEAFGISVVEAMACGLPVLASRNGGMVEIVVEGETGLLLPPNNLLAWRDAIALMIASPERVSEMGRAGRRRVEEGFSWAANARQLEALLMTRGKDQCAA